MTQSSVPPGPEAMPEPSTIHQIAEGMFPIVIVEPYPPIRSAVADRVNLQIPGLRVSQFSSQQDAQFALHPTSQIHMFVTALEMKHGNGIDLAQQAFAGEQVDHVALMTDRTLSYLQKMFGEKIIEELLDKGLKILRKPHLDQLDEVVINPLRAKFAPRSS